MCLPKLEDVVSGREPVPGAISGEDTLYYTVEEYYNHLMKIIWYLEEYPNYHAIFLDDLELENVVIYTKGYDRAMLIKEAEPFASIQRSTTSLIGTIE